MYILFKCSSKTAVLSRLFKASTTMSNFMNKEFNGDFSSEFSVLMLKEVIAIILEYVYETKN